MVDDSSEKGYKSVVLKEKAILRYVNCLRIVYGISVLVFLCLLCAFPFFSDYLEKVLLKDIYTGIPDEFLIKKYIVMGMALFVMLFCLFKFAKYSHLKIDLLRKEYLLNLLLESNEILDENNKNNHALPSENGNQKLTDDSGRIKERESNFNLFIRTHISQPEKNLTKDFWEKFLMMDK